MSHSHNLKNPDFVQPCYRKFSAGSLLADYIQCYWTITSNSQIHSPVFNRILPDGCIDIIFNLGDPFYRVSHDLSVNYLPQNFVVGAMRQPLVVGLTGQVEVIGVRFKPGGAYPFFRFPLNEMTDHLVALDDLRHQIVNEMEFHIAEKATITRKIAYLEYLLARHIQAAPHKDGIIGKAISNICDSKGQVTINSLGKLLGISSRHLERKFIENVGLSPKMFCRVIRVRNAISIMRSQSKPDWSEITYSAGFYDQAHFIREFKAISGLNPGAYVNERK